MENLVAGNLLKAIHFGTDRGRREYWLYYLLTKNKVETDFLIVKKGKPWFLVEVRAKAKDLTSAPFPFQKETRVPRAFQVAFNLPFVNKDCFSCLVPARTFFLN